MTTQYALLVGTHFNKPAGTVLRCLEPGAPVRLQPDPENPYDPLAVKVILVGGRISLTTLDSFGEELAGCGTTVEEVMKKIFLEEGLMLGHVAASGGKPVEKARKKGLVLVGTEELVASQRQIATLEFVAGETLIKIEDEPAARSEDGE